MTLDLLPRLESLAFRSDPDPLGDLSALDLADSGLPEIVGHTKALGNASSIVLTIPTYAQADQVAVIFWSSQDGYTLTNPSGWTQYDAGVAGNQQYRVLWRVLAGGDPGTTATLTTATANKQLGLMVVLSGLDTADPFVDEPAETADGTTSATRTNPTATLTGERLALSAVLSRGSAGVTSWAAPPGWVKFQEGYNTSAGSTTGALAWRTADTSAGGDVWTSNVADANAVTYVLPINPAGVDNALSGTVALTSTATGGIALQAALSGTSAATSATTGAVALQASISGTADATSTATGSITAVMALSGTADATSGATGEVGVRVPLAGTVTATTDTSGAPALLATLTGTVAAISGASGDLTGADTGLSGTVALLTGTSGTLALQAALTGTVGADSGTSGAVALRAGLAGVVDAITGTSGAVTLTAALSGTAPVTTAASGDLTATYTLSGTAAVESGTTGSLAATLGLAGTVVVTSTASGDLTVMATITADGALIFHVPAQARVHHVPAQERVHPVRAQRRIHPVPGQERIFSVRAQRRIFTTTRG